MNHKTFLFFIIALALVFALGCQKEAKKGPGFIEPIKSSSPPPITGQAVGTFDIPDKDEKPEPAPQPEEVKPKGTIECYEDSDCGEKTYTKLFCQQGLLAKEFTGFECVNAGSTLSECKPDSGTDLEECDPDTEFCLQGECLVIKEQPCTDSDGGKNYTVQGKVVDGKRERKVDYCKDKFILYEAYCTSGKLGVFEKKICPHKCDGGECVEED